MSWTLRMTVSSCVAIVLLDLAQPLIYPWRVKFIGALLGACIYGVAAALIMRRHSRRALWVVALMPLIPLTALAAAALGAPFPVDRPMRVIACVQVLASGFAWSALATKEQVARAISVLTYPVMTTLAVLVALGLRAQGVPSSLTMIGVTVAISLALFALERVAPFRRDWGVQGKAFASDITHAIVSNGIPSVLLEISIKASLLQFAFWLRGNHDLDLWPDSWPMAAQVFLALLAAEAPFYLAHRAFHESGIKWLWRLHSVHHSTTRMYFFAGTRTHPLQVLISFGATVAVLWALGAPNEVILLKTVVHSTNGLLQHCNLDLRLGPLNWLIAGTELHRWHHSQLIEESNSNYGNNLILFDVLFGSHFLPRERSGPDTLGLLPHVSFDDDFVGHMRLPFLSSHDKRPPEST